MSYIDILETPFGQITITASDIGVTRVAFSDDSQIVVQGSDITTLAKKELIAYIAGELKVFTVPLDLSGYSDFSFRVWQELIKIPFGTTISYKTLAINLGNVKCVRAAGTANGRNPIPIIVPCHRVIGSDGSLTGYALGLDVKKQLLVLENADFNHSRQFELPL